MLDSQSFNPNNAEISQFQKLGKVALKGPAEAAAEKQAQPQVQEAESALMWTVVQEKEGGLKLEATPNTHLIDVTSVSVYAEEVSAPRELNFFGYKIDLKAKVDGFKENYIKNFALTKSHNLMVARFAEMKTGLYAYLLSLLGVSSEDLRKLQKKAITGSIQQNKALFEENEYNGELLGIVGGGGRKLMRQQEKIIGEIRDQLMVQAKNLGLRDHYTPERVIEIKIEQCRKIMGKFQEEKNNLEFQLAYSGVN